MSQTRSIKRKVAAKTHYAEPKMLTKIIALLESLFFRIRASCERYSRSSNNLNVYWWRSRRNLGDALNPILISFLDGDRKVRWAPNNFRASHYLAIGSILHNATHNSIVWGSGFIREDDRPASRPAQVLAVRGPKTRDRLLELGIACPPVYGDPALLLPLYFNPEVNPRYELGLIPHYVDKNRPFFHQTFPEDFLLIDIETEDFKSFVESLKSCRKILSSSLHGIILADAYGIPAHRIKLGEDITGGDFKFEDYFLSVGRRLEQPIQSRRILNSRT